MKLQTSHVVAGFVAVLVGYTGSVAIVFQAASAAGASASQLDSWLLILGGGMALTSAGFSLWYRAPVLTAWSTPGAALLATSLLGFGMAEAVGAFIVCGLLVTLTGLTGLFDRVSSLIPPTIASALLAGILLRFGLDAFALVEGEPGLAGTMLLVFFIALRAAPRYAVPLALIAGCVVAGVTGQFRTDAIVLEFASLEWTTPRFTVAAAVGVSLPLYFVTMASQNVPGVAVLRSFGYETPISPLITGTGLMTMLGAPFGGFAYNLAAITAAICAGDEAGADRRYRYLASVSAGGFYLLTAIFGATVASLLAASPQGLVVTIAGIALMGVITNSLAAGLGDASTRTAAGVTFLVAASGISIGGIGAAFWALVVGMLIARLLAVRED